MSRETALHALQKSRSGTLLVAALVAILLLLTAANPLFAASSERVLYSFCTLAGCPDGYSPVGAAIFDAAGNLYGVTFFGGRHGDGTAFELMPDNGKWKEKVLHEFNRHGKDGAFPLGGLILDAAGSLYGTTSCYVYACGTYGYGNVFELTLSNGRWTETVLHSFNNTDGAYPEAGLIFGAAGNLYGTTVIGGAYGQGTVFELVPKHGTWTEKVLHSFNPKSGDGAEPTASLVVDASGNLYGTTSDGGTYGYGIAFELIPNNGTWTEKVLYSLGQSGSDGANPGAALVVDEAGNLFGTTNGGGENGYGTVFELLQNNGNWTEEVLYSFEGKDDANPQGVILDGAGNLYGASRGEGITGGTVFELIYSDDRWTHQVLHRFTRVKDGKSPAGPLVFDATRNLYGLTGNGGAGGNGTVFEVKP
jgi:uncharacterized repeat protein (TIGR03803 family)